MAEYQFQPTLSGLNNVNANSIDSNELDVTTVNCTNLTITGVGVAPTQSSGDNSTNIATTAYVDTEIANNSILTLDNSWSGENSFAGVSNFNNWAYFNSGTQVATQLQGDDSTKIANTKYVNNELIEFRRQSNTYTEVYGAGTAIQDFTGVDILVPTLGTGDSTTNASSTAFVQGELTNLLTLNNNFSGQNTFSNNNTFSGDNTHSGDNDFTGQNRFGDTLTNVNNNVIVIENTSNSNTNKQGTYWNESIYNLIRLSERFNFAKGATSVENLYLMHNTGGTNTQRTVLSITKYGLKIQNATAGGNTTYNPSNCQLYCVGNTDITGTCKIGSPPAAQGGVALNVASTTVDSSVNGTIGGENVYSHLQMGARAWVFAQGVDSTNCYMGESGGGGNDPDFEYTFRRGAGLKISPNGTDTATFTEALKVCGTAKIQGTLTLETGDLVVNDIEGENASDNITLYGNTTGDVLIGNQSNSVDSTTALYNRNTGCVCTHTDGVLNLYSNDIQIQHRVSQSSGSKTTITSETLLMTPTYANAKGFVAGVWLFDGSGANYNCVPLFYSCSDLANIYGQADTSSNVSTSQSGSAVGKFSTFSSFSNANDQIIVLPNYGLIGYDGTAYSSTIVINFKNTSSKAVVVRCSSDNIMSSVKIYFDDTEQT